MKSEKYSQYHYRENADGTIDSICLRCYLSAGSARNETVLHALETAHRCGGKPAGANMGLSEERIHRQYLHCQMIKIVCPALGFRGSRQKTWRSSLIPMQPLMKPLKKMPEPQR
jgi:hypothetical protein